MATIAAMSSRGQIVLPIAIRRKLGLGEGTQFLVVTDNENILLKPVKDPSLDEFYSLIEQAQKTAAQLGLTEDEINTEIKSILILTSYKHFIHKIRKSYPQFVNNFC